MEGCALTRRPSGYEPDANRLNPASDAAFRHLSFCAYLCADLSQRHFLALRGQSYHILAASALPQGDPQGDVHTMRMVWTKHRGS